MTSSGKSLTKQEQFKAELSLAYANLDQTGVSTGQPIAVQTGAASFVWVPTTIERGNTLNTTFKTNASGDRGAELRVSWLYTF